METGAGLDMRPAGERNRARRRRPQCQGEVNGLQDKSNGARGADIEMVISRHDFPGLKSQVAAAQRIASGLRLVNGGSRAYAHQMLGP